MELQVDPKARRVVEALKAAKHANRRMTQAALSAQCGISYGTCSSIIRALRYAGLVQTSSDGTEWIGASDE